MADSSTYDPYWTAVSPFTPQQNGESSAICTEEMKTYFSSLLSRKVIGVRSDLVGHGVFNVVSFPFLSSFHSYTHLRPGIRPYFQRSWATCRRTHLLQFQGNESNMLFLEHNQCVISDQDTEEGRKYASETTKQEVAILKFLETRAPEVIAPRVLGYDNEPQNEIGSPFILESRISGCDLLHCSINETFWQNFSFVSIFGCL